MAALFKKDYSVAGELIEADEFHEQYRSSLVPELAKIRQISHANGAVATYLSGAGPTVMTIIDSEKTTTFINAVRQAKLNDRIEVLHPDPDGVVIKPEP